MVQILLKIFLLVCEYKGRNGGRREAWLFSFFLSRFCRAPKVHDEICEYRIIGQSQKHSARDRNLEVLDCLFSIRLKFRISNWIFSIHILSISFSRIFKSNLWSTGYRMGRYCTKSTSCIIWQWYIDKKWNCRFPQCQVQQVLWLVEIMHFLVQLVRPQRLFQDHNLD